jgi:membrane-bound serine protease (ClpP class)
LKECAIASRNPDVERAPGVCSAAAIARPVRGAAISLYIAVILGGLLAAVLSLAQDPSRVALRYTVADAITPATMDYIRRGIARAESDGAELLIIELDTPGGLMSSTRDMIKTILASRVPIVTYVSPSGSRAASAGTYILLASHIAAMAPATHLGSATPVQMGGLPGLPSEESDKQPSRPGAVEEDSERGAPSDSPPAPAGSAIERKVLEDAVSYIRELAERHGRNATWAERAVREAANLGAREAREQNVIDLVAADVDELLQKIDGRTVQLASGPRTLNTQGLQLESVEPDWRTRLLSVITDPNIAYFLLLIGFYGIIFEFSNPGGLFPGVIGATCLLLALFAFQILSVNYAGLALILLGLAFIVAEAFVPSFGVLGIGGLVAFVAGSVILMDGNNQAVSLPVVGGVAAVAAGFLLWTVTRLMSLRREIPVYGIEHLGEEAAVASESFNEDHGQYRGHVRMNGERWRAVSESPVSAGDSLRVLAVDGLTLKVTSSS